MRKTVSLGFGMLVSMIAVLGIVMPATASAAQAPAARVSTVVPQCSLTVTPKSGVGG